VAIYVLSRSLASEPRRCRAQTRPSPEDELPAHSGITIIVCSGFAGPGPITPWPLEALKPPGTLVQAGHPDTLWASGTDLAVVPHL
jgi:hypothetical protein